MRTLSLQMMDGCKVTPSERAFAAFERDLAGELLGPDSPDFGRARRLWNGMIDSSPGLIARCLGAADVSLALRFAMDHGLLVAVRGGGHNVAGLATCTGGLIIDLSQMREVHVDPARAAVRISGGATLGDVDRETTRFGLSTPSGVVSETGYSGLTLHGGMGWQLRRYGLSSDNLYAVELVTADGALHRADSQQNQDLFWAVRGGGGGFGVVTAFEAALHPVPPQVLFGLPIFALDQAPAVLRFLRDYMPAAPEELMVIAAFWTIPELPEVPAAHRGAHGLFLLAGFAGPPSDAKPVMQPLRSCAPAVVDLSEIKSWVEVQRALDEDYPDGRRYYWKSTFADGLSDAMIDALVSQTAARPSLLSSIDLWFLGGAFARFNPRSTAFGRRDAPLLINYEANWDDPDDDEANIGWTSRSLGTLQHHTQTRTYLNFPGLVEEGKEMVRASFGENYERLTQIKKQMDPHNLLRGAFRF